MSLLDTYRNAVTRKQEELAKLKGDLSKKQAKIPPLQRKIVSANNSLKRTKSQSTIKSKLREIEHANKTITDTNKECSNLQKKIAKKEKELATAEKNMRNEEEKRTKVQNAHFSAIEQTIEQQASAQALMRADIDKLKALPKKITVLFMAANPNDTQPLMLDEEVRAIQNNIRLSDYRDSIQFESRWAVRSGDIIQAINETTPTIIHFSGHGAESGDLVLLKPDGKKEFVAKEAITAAISTVSDTVRLVVFNTCFSAAQAVSVVQNIEAAIGMSDSVQDDTAITFAAQLYSSIGFGHSLEKSYRQAIAAIMLAGIPQNDVPQLFLRDGIDPNEVVLVNPN